MQFLREELTRPKGYVTQAGKPSPAQRAVALPQQGQPVYSTNRTGRSSIQSKGLIYASGTTSTLAIAATTFADLQTEAKREYVLACVAYLVGGGMHTCHEVFWTGRLWQVPYMEGQYAPTLPKTFTSSRDYEKWTAEFWDVI